ncbi:putative membrane protein [Campylobacter blaseri]|uniref:Tryptophan-rich sensory protein n=1 Tax=Campylobacter blaseri TaxID=2042961 RepID=A0A2P8QZT2_9BACT|nr:tryptophan-rich sensory protein [Campylobacter blaseri]PSM51749.1 tryptophan-rich sensory protein [Campylobacter blaseri]PSM53540.1 tryptophan-rich sensory protein [Campylobacter blaseri]QKF86347.1 putative membrane protein [Campylobacter blaseri]
MHQKNLKNLVFLNFVFYALVILFNIFAYVGFLNNIEFQGIINKYPTLITPINFTFSIWIPIYILLLLTLVYLYKNQYNSYKKTLIKPISILFIISSLFNIAWIISFIFERFWIALLMIAGLLTMLMFILDEIYKKRSALNFFSLAVFTIYASWILMLTIITATIFAAQQNWGGLGGIPIPIWTIVVILSTTGFAVFYMFYYKNALFSFGIIWTFVGIYLSYSAGKIKTDMGSSIKFTIFTAIIILIISMIYIFQKNKKSILPKKHYRV